MKKNEWSLEELEILKVNFSCLKISKLKLLLPTKSQTGIYRKARELELERNSNCWSNWRIEEARKRHHNHSRPRIFSKEITAWLGSSISCDGSIKSRGKNSLDVVILASVEKDWVLQSGNLLKANDINFTISQPKDGYRFEIRLLNSDAIAFYFSLKEHRLFNFLMSRKLQKLENYLLNMGWNLKGGMPDEYKISSET